ncbi:MAG TPA: tRNA-binding protein [Actinomycetes bacterium]
MAIEYADFDRVDMRTGLVMAVEEFSRARTPSYKVQVDFGPEVGVKWSSAQAKRDYQAEELLGRQLVAVVNLHPKNIAGFNSEVLLLGVPAQDGGLSLLVPSRPARPGGRVY